MSVKFKIKPPMEEVAARFEQRRKNFSDFEPAHKKVAIYFDSWVQRNFKKEGSELGSDAWPAFFFGGRVVNGGVDTSAKLLQDTGRLRLSFLPFADKKNAGIGSELLYSENHEEGLGTPKRRILPIADEVRERITEILELHGRKTLRLE